MPNTWYAFRNWFCIDTVKYVLIRYMNFVRHTRPSPVTVAQIFEDRIH